MFLSIRFFEQYWYIAFFAISLVNTVLVTASAGFINYLVTYVEGFVICMILKLKLGLILDQVFLYIHFNVCTAHYLQNFAINTAVYISKLHGLILVLIIRYYSTLNFCPYIDPGYM